ncbi:ribonuclease domain-containing protein [Corynebacterium kroppenstedtii]|uniref:ribonuclease domain-containing protein n=1 Tax=Corynebacterium sp. PCR 32 TaxID=3351342 RepID=UPI0030AEDC5B
MSNPRSSDQQRRLVSTSTLMSILAIVAAGAAGLWGWDATTNHSTDHATTPDHDRGTPSHTRKTRPIPTCDTTTLPAQANIVIRDIKSGGPFDYPGKDGSHFGNYDHVLPRHTSNYYREYTVDEDKNDHNRGPARIVTGGGTPTKPDVWYFTSDHYSSFCSMTEH